jgi:hypothetical protein
MNACSSVLIVGLLMFSGCDRRQTQPINGIDYTYQSRRQQLNGQAIPFPVNTPYDGDKVLRAAFLEGFKTGWEIALRSWLGNLIGVPEAYQEPEAVRKAWNEGCDAGQAALGERVLGRPIRSPVAK